MTPEHDQIGESVCTHYDVGAVHNVQKHPTGFLNTTYRVDADFGAFALTVFQQKTLDEISARADILLRLRNTPVAPPLLSRKRSPVVDLDGLPAWLAPWIEGESFVGQQHHEKFPMSLQQHREVIRVFHLLHDELALLSSSGTDLKLFESRTQDAESDFPASEEIQTLIARCRECYGSVTNLATSSTQIVHRDFERQNLLFKENRLVSVVDFDALGKGDVEEEWAHCIFNHACCDPNVTPECLDMYVEATGSDTRKALLTSMARFCEKDLQDFLYVAKRRKVDLDSLGAHYSKALTFAIQHLS